MTDTTTDPEQPPEIKIDWLKLKAGVKDGILKQAEAIEKAYRMRSKDSFLLFSGGLVIDSQSGPRELQGVIADFQRVCFEDLAPNLEAVRDGDLPAMRRFWIERTKKASKDADLAVIVCWLTAFPTRPFYGQIGAADRDQAAIVRDRVSALLHYNPWLNEHMELVGNEIRSKKTRPDGKALARFDIKSSDVAGAHGGTPDLLIVNELSHITKWEFAQNMLDNADGVAQGIVIIATNAGIKNTPAWTWRLNAMASEEWSVHVLAQPAPWHTRSTVEEARKRNPADRFKRLWKGVWVSGRSDAVDEAKLDKVFCLKGPTEPNKEWTCVAGLDLGITHDHSAVVVLGVNETARRIRLMRFKVWKPPKGGEINLMDVEEQTLALCRHYGVLSIVYDPYQAKLMAQRLSKHIRTVEMTFSSATNLTRMASDFLQVVNNEEIEAYDEDGSVRSDFEKFDIVERGETYRLEAVSDESGHADVGTALVICLPAAVEMLRGAFALFREDDDLVYEEEKDLTADEVKELPDSLRSIYGTG